MRGANKQSRLQKHEQLVVVYSTVLHGSIYYSIL